MTSTSTADIDARNNLVCLDPFSHVHGGLGSIRHLLRQKSLMCAFIMAGLVLFTIHPGLFPGFTKNPATSGIRVKLGNEKAAAEFPSRIRSKRIGLVINHTSVLPDGTPLLKAFSDKGLNIRAIFSPEHGFSGTEEGGINVENSTFKGIPVFSLYGKTKRPEAQQMQHIDAFVYDIQDVGTRFYTYISTLKYVLEAASEANKEVYVLDRPNPTGGLIVEGPLLKERLRSFIGACPLPIRYGLTPGELALMMKGEGWVPEDVELHVVKMDGWKRHYFWEDTGLTWIPTSPNMPKPETAIAYPGMGLLGSIVLNHGLGTADPFLRFGAPWLDAKLLHDELGGGEAFGIALEHLSYTPLSLPGKVLHPPYENGLCNGLQIRIREKGNFLSVRFALSIIQAVKKNHPAELKLKPGNLNRLFGDDFLVQYLTGQVSFKSLMDKIAEEESFFLAKRRKYLLYE